MPIRRRVLLGAGLLGCATACVPDSVIEGQPTQPWQPADPQPVQEPADAEAAAVMLHLRKQLDLLGAKEQASAEWMKAARETLETQANRLLWADPFTQPDVVFDPPGTSNTQQATWMEAARVAAKKCRQLAQQADSQPRRLLYASLAASCRGLQNPSRVPSNDLNQPYWFPDLSLEASMHAAVTHIWALIQTLERGLGTMGLDDPQREGVVSRLDRAKGQRNRLRAACESVPEQSLNYQEDGDDFTAAWRARELHFLSALGRVVAAGDMNFIDDFIGQPDHLHNAGQAVPVWPGWVKG